MNFLYLYPTYQEAREAYSKKMYEDQKVPMADVDNLVFKTVSDRHTFRYVPIRVNIDLERLGLQASVVAVQPLIEELCKQVKDQLIELNNYVVKAQAFEYELRERTRSSSGKNLQTKDATPAGGNPDSGSPELGTKTISGPSLLQGRFDF